MDNIKYLIWLSSLPSIGSIRTHKLINYFKSAKNVFHASGSELLNSGAISQRISNIILENKDLDKIDRYMKKVNEKGIQLLSFQDEEYPKNLKSIYDPPPILYVMGKLKAEDANAISIVGSRKSSEYGLQMAQKFSRELSEMGITIVSGMALGIDTNAHRGALDGKGRTIAVMGSGFNHIYPKSNYQLAENIVKNGAIISEYPLGMQALPENFPARNRIISGMSLGVLIVEAAEKSGSLITADFALEQGRDVFAIPGNINEVNSKGTNNLIKNGAILTSSIEDILNELRIEINEDCVYNIQDNRSKYINELSDIQREIVDRLEKEPCDLDKLILLTNISAKDLLANLSLLDIKGIVYTMNDKYYIEN